MTFTVDVENHRPTVETIDGEVPRYQVMTLKLLAFLGEHGIRGTFFVEGDVARLAPALVRRIAGLGHEVASHSYRHVALARETPSRFAAGMAATKARLEDLAGAAVLGFRAPGFSLTPGTVWVTDCLRAAGFVYSSSVVPGRSLTPSFPAAPRAPFLWPSGLLEIPCPVGRLGPFWLPFQGGMYLRYLTPWRYRGLAAQLGDQVNWTYCHPYDIDAEEPFARFPGCGWVASLLLWRNRRRLLRRWQILAATPDLPFAERLPALFERAGGQCTEPYEGAPRPGQAQLVPTGAPPGAGQT